MSVEKGSRKVDTIKINFCGFWSSFHKDDNLFTRLLSRHFNVELSDTPDFVICSNRGRPFEYMKYDCVRLMFMGENLSPDFTAFDYVIGFDHLTFGDRYFRLPFAFYSDNGLPWKPSALTRAEAEEVLRGKTEFCNFIYGHPSAHGMRERLFLALQEYKPVVSPGSYLNNVDGSGCTWLEKYDYLRRSKFTIACDSISYPGFVTEKVIQPFQQHSVPIYFGSPTIGEDINPEAMLWCCEATDAEIDRIVKEAAYLDAHEEAYLELLMACPLPRRDMLEERYAALEDFLVNIFSQAPSDAARRVKNFAAAGHEDLLRESMRKNETDPFLLRAKMKAAKFLKKI